MEVGRSATQLKFWDETGAVLGRACRALAGRSRETITGHLSLKQRCTWADIRKNSSHPARAGQRRCGSAARKVARQGVVAKRIYNIEKNSNSSAGTERCAVLALAHGSPGSEMNRAAMQAVHYKGGFERGRWGKSWKQGRENELHPLFS